MKFSSVELYIVIASNVTYTAVFLVCSVLFLCVCTSSVYQFCVQDASLAYGNKFPSQEMDASVMTKFALPRPHLMGRKKVE